MAEQTATASRLHRISDEILDALAWTRVGWFVYWGIVGLCFYVWAIAAAVWAYQIYTGFVITGLDHPVMWGFYITAFVFWIGIAHSGTLVSAILFLFRAEWRTPVARIAETMTIVAVSTAALFPVVHLGRSWRVYWLIPYPNQRGLWPNFSSPLLWDAAAVGTYFVVSLLFWFMDLVPDFALLRDRSSGWAYTIYRGLALGWSGTAGQWRYFRSAYTLLAALVTALVISVHSIVSWDFAMAIVPGWHSSIFAPYFVSGAILSGLSMLLTLAIPGRELLGIRQYVTDRHLENIARLIIAVSLIVTYSYISEFFFAWLGDDGYVRNTFIDRANGRYAPLFWLAIVCNAIVPLTFFFDVVRRSAWKLFVASLLINVGMWSERLLIIVSSLAHEFNAYSWGAYLPRWPEWTIVIGSAAWFLFWFLLIIGHVPPVSIADMKANVLEREADKVPGILAVFDDRERVLAAVRRAKADGLLRLTAYAPAYDCELVEAGSAAPTPGIGPVAFAGGLIGLISGLTLTIWTALQWPVLMVGGKPLVAVPPFLVIAFVMLILFAATATVGMLVLHAVGTRPPLGAAYDRRFSDALFGLWIECPQSRIPAVMDTMRHLGAVECRLV